MKVPVSLMLDQERGDVIVVAVAAENGIPAKDVEAVVNYRFAQRKRRQTVVVRRKRRVTIG